MSKDAMKRKPDVPTDVLEAELKPQLEDKKIKRGPGQVMSQRAESSKNPG